MALSISWESTFADFKAAQNLHHRSRLASILSYRVVPIVTLALWVLAFVAAVRGTPFTLADLLTWTIPLTVYSIFVWVARIYAIRKAYKNSWPVNAKRKVNTLTFSDEGVDVASSEVGSSHLLWSAFYRISENKNILMLCISKTKWCAIPKRAMTEAQILELRSLCNAHIQGAS